MEKKKLQRAKELEKLIEDTSNFLTRLEYEYHNITNIDLEIKGYLNPHSNDFKECIINKKSYLDTKTNDFIYETLIETKERVINKVRKYLIQLETEFKNL